MQSEEGEEASSLFIILTDEQEFPFARPFVPEVSPFLFPLFLSLGAAVNGIANILMPPKSILHCEDYGASFEARVNLNLPPE
jgi:hypothetical protein